MAAKKTGRKAPMTALKEKNEALAAENAAKDAELAELRRTLAANNPVNSTRGVVDTDDADSFGQDNERVMHSTGPAMESLEAPKVETVDGPVNPEWANEMKFMEDPLLVSIHESEDPNADPFPCVTVNGRNQYFIRGEEQRVKRKFVERLLRMKKTRYSQRKERDADGNDTYVNVPHTVLAVPFAILEDPAGQRGRDWYEKVRREP